MSRADEPFVGDDPVARTSAGEPLLRVQRLTAELESDSGALRAVDDLALSIDRGESFALVGESGCGKSMTALALVRLLPDNGRILRGEVQLGELDVFARRERQMRTVRGRRIGMVFQEPATSLNPVMTVGRQIGEVIRRHTRLRGAAARAQAVRWLDRVGLPEPAQYLDRYPFQLSGGQKQRVMIAQALAGEPELLIADEPTTALDVTVQGQILTLLSDLRAERRMAMMLITHDLAIVSDHAHRVALMYAGQIVELSSSADFFKAPRHPYAQMLMQALPGAGKRGDELAAIPGSVPSLARRFTGCRFVDRCPQAHEACEKPPPMVTVGEGHWVRCVLYDRRARVVLAPREERIPSFLRKAPIDGEAVDLFARPRPAPDDPPARPPRPDEVAIPVGLRAPGHRSMAAAPVAGTGSADAVGDGRGAVTPAEAVDAPVDPLLRVEDLRVQFSLQRGLLMRTAGRTTAVDGVSFEIGRGRTLALVGESGSGKTTVAKAMLQLLRRQARVSGRVLLGGRDLFSLGGEALRVARGDIQIVFQDPFASLNPRMTIAEVLEEGVRALQPRLDAASRRRRIAGLVDRVGLHAEALARFPHEFSGGQRQRIAIARALAVQPRLLICDEPTSALDVSVQAQILNLLRELQRESGMSYLFITHNIGVVEYIADEVAVMRAGRIVEQGPALQVLDAPSDDYTRSLLAAVPRLRLPDPWAAGRVS